MECRAPLPLVPGRAGLVCDDGEGQGCAVDTGVWLCTVWPARAFSLVTWWWAGLLVVVTLNRCTHRGSESCSDGLRVLRLLESLTLSPGARGAFLYRLEQAQVGCASVGSEGGEEAAPSQWLPWLCIHCFLYSHPIALRAHCPQSPLRQHHWLPDLLSQLSAPLSMSLGPCKSL